MELSTEQKAEAYDRALKKASEFYNNEECRVGMTPVDLESIFPELKESEDEKISKALIHLITEQDGYLTAVNGISTKDIIAWLEKQCEQKSADKVEPKFKVGDWIVYNDNLYHIGNIALQRYYECLRVDGTVHTFSLDIDSKSHLWTIEDAKAGDVLINNNAKYPFIFKQTKSSDIKTDIKNPLTVLGYCGIGGAGFTKSSRWGDTINCTYYPATKGQCDTLEKAMADAGYEWDAKKKELKKIEQKHVIDYPDSPLKDNWELVHEFVNKFGRIPKDEDELNVLIEYVLKRQKSICRRYTCFT